MMKRIDILAKWLAVAAGIVLTGLVFLTFTDVLMRYLFLAPILAYLEQMPEGPALFAGAPNVQRAFAAISGRPSFQATMPPPPPGEASAA